MSITLKIKNFRCWDNVSFEFPTTGIHLLNGSSGSGKSTILAAFVLGFYGVGKKLSTQKSIIEISGTSINDESYKIVRSTKPMSVVVYVNSEKYESDAAQNYIDTQITNLTQTEFMCGAYFSQNTCPSIISNSPADQLELIEKIITPNDEHLQLISKLTNAKTKLTNEHTSTLSTLELISENVKDDVDDTPDLQTSYTFIKTEYENSSHAIQEYSKNQDEIEKLKNEKTEYEKEMLMLHTATHNFNENKIQELENTLSNAQKLVSSSTLNITQLNKYYNTKESLEKLQESYNVKTKYLTEQRSLHLSQILTDENYANIKTSISQFQKMKNACEKYDEYLTMVTNFSKEYPYFIHTHENYVYKKNLLEENLKYLSSKKMICPRCECRVCLIDGELCVSRYKTSNNHLIDAYTQLYTRVSELVNKHTTKPMMTLHELHKKIEELQTIVFNSDSSKSQASTLYNKLHSTELETLKRNIHNLQTTLKSCECEDDSEEFFESQIKIRNDNSYVIDVTTKHLRDIHLSQTKHKESEKRIKFITSELERINSQLKDLGSTQTQISFVDHAKLTERYTLIKEQYDRAQSHLKLKSQMADLQTRLSVIDKSLTHVNSLLELAKQSRLIAIENFIELLNNTARKYLSEMFEDEIQVEILSQKILKSNQYRNSLSLNVVRNNIEMSLDSLSGGERQRVEISFLLALNEMRGGTMLLLDECVNNLDGEMNTQILKLIKSYSNTKLVIVVSHEALCGIFDSVIEIGK